MSKFKERLWRDLMREHRSELAQIDRPAAGRARYARPRLLAGTTVGFAVIATAIVLFLSAASTPAAFAVSGNSDGTVSVMLRRIAGIKGANERLQALGIRAKFVQVVSGCRAAVPPAALAQIKTPDQVLSHAGRQTRIDPREIPPGRMLMIVSWIKARKVHVAKLGPAGKAAPDCIAGPAPQALRFAWAVAHGCHIGEVKARPTWPSRVDRAVPGPSRVSLAAKSPSTWVGSTARAAHPPATAGRSRGTAAHPPATAADP